MNLTEITKLTGLVVACITIGGVIKTYLIDPIATKDYHNESTQPMFEQMNRVEVNSLVPRMNNALNAVCELRLKKVNPELALNVVDELAADYQRLTGREYPRGGCKDGKRERQ